MGATTRFAIRAALTGFAAANASLLTVALKSGAVGAFDFQIAGMIGFGAALAFAGIGVAIPQVDGSIGNKISPSQAAEEAADTLFEATVETNAVAAATEGVVAVTV